jgi:putative Mn2+ efflux pump MntP
MSLFEIILIAVGLSMDAFAVSITLGLSVKKPKAKEYLIPGIYFGFFQALMPFIGYFAGTHFADKIQGIDHWVAFALLGFIGGNMIKESLSKDGGGKGECGMRNAECGTGNKAGENPFGMTKMLLLAVATSIDALAVGVTFAFFKINIFMAIAIIGITACCISIGGVKIGNIFGTRFKSKAEFIGGAVLVILGAKMLVEGLFFHK